MWVFCPMYYGLKNGKFIKRGNMKILIITILFASAFADTITYEKNSAIGYKEYYLQQVEFDGITNGKVFYTYTLSKSKSNDPQVLGNIKYSDTSFTNFTNSLPISCDQILSISDDEGNPIEFDCYTDQTGPDQIGPVISETDNSTVVTRFGGILIMAGAGMLYSNTSDDCSDCDLEELQSFTKDSQDKQKVAYMLIAVGGLLIALGG